MHKPETKEKVALPQGELHPIHVQTLPKAPPGCPSCASWGWEMAITTTGHGDMRREVEAGGQLGPTTRGKRHPQAATLYFGNPRLYCTAVALNSAPGTRGHEQGF